MDSEFAHEYPKQIIYNDTVTAMMKAHISHHWILASLNPLPTCIESHLFRKYNGV